MRNDRDENARGVLRGIVSKAPFLALSVANSKIKKNTTPLFAQFPHLQRTLVLPCLRFMVTPCIN